MCVQATAQTTADVQKQYLAGVQYLFDQGLYCASYSALATTSIKYSDSVAVIMVSSAFCGQKGTLIPWYIIRH